MTFSFATETVALARCYVVWVPMHKAALRITDYFSPEQVAERRRVAAFERALAASAAAHRAWLRGLACSAFRKSSEVTA